jgi:hypothetical protein
MKPPPTDPPSPRRNDDEASARQARETPRRSDDEASARPAPGKRPGGHGSYRLSDEDNAARQAPAQRPGGHGSYRLSDRSEGARYDDGVVHTPHYDADGHDDLHNEDTGHEHRDVNIRALIASGVTLAAVTIASMIVTYGLMDRFEAMATSNDPQLSPLATPPVDMPKTTRESPYFSTGVRGPQLLTNEPVALGEQRRKEAKQLHGYGWVSQPGGVAHIPIEEAKKLILQRGLPVRTEGPVGPLVGTRLPAWGESSGGRVITTTLPDRPDAPSEQKPAEAGPTHKPGGH